MKDQSGQVDDSESDAVAMEAQEPVRSTKTLDPCGKPQAQEAQRFDGEDGACDDGVQ